MLALFLFTLYLISLSLMIYYQRQHPQKWWVKIVTHKPRCLYYFGPFESQQEAKENQAYYLEDLQKEGAIGITINIEHCNPLYLTIDEEDSEVSLSVG